MLLHKTPALVQWLYPNLIWKKKTNEKEIYLTFDDGPIPGLTEFVLDTLQKFSIKATFFCVGENLRKNKDIANRILSEGHRVGNHTFNHLNGWNSPTVDYISNVVRCQKELVDLSNRQPQLFRPPYGQIKRSQISQLKTKFQIIMWDVLSGDFSSSVSPETCLNKTIKATRKGSIVIFHDNIKAERNLKYALPRYIEHYLNLDYKFKTL